MNTLSAGSRRKFSDEHSPTNGAEAKRQKRETPQSSPYFAKPKTPKQPKQATYDLTAEGSQDDIYDIRSVSSSGGASQNAVNGLSEYRNAEPKVKTTPTRRRRSREVRSSLLHRDRSSSNIINSEKRSEPSKSAAYQTIPDDAGDPPPANVVSDITKSGRSEKGGLLSAPRIVRNEPQVKRQKPLASKEPIDVSEDELQIAQITPSGPVRRTNFSSIIVSPRHERKMRGDITPTAFSKAKSGEGTLSSPLEVLRAASGKCTYDAEVSQRPAIMLCQSRDNPSRLETRRNGKRDKKFPWLCISVNQVGKVHYHGRHVLLHRSLGPGISPKLAIELATEEGTRLLLSMIDGEVIECSSDHIHRMVDKAWSDAKKCQDDAKLDVDRREKASRRDDIEDSSLQEADKEEYTKPAPGTRREKLKDGMRRGATNTDESNKASNEEDDDSLPSLPRRGMETRSTKKPSGTRDPTDRDSYKWSKVNKGWMADWKQTLVYPATGRNRTSVEFDDINRLDNAEFVNDNVLSFYIRYIQDKMARERPDLVSRVHIFSTFFYEKLNPAGGMNYAGVRSWTNKVDIFSYDYNIIPVNESNHWYLAIICHAPKLIELTNRNATMTNDDEDDKEDTADSAAQERRDSPEMGVVESQMSDISLNESLVPRRTTRQTLSGLSSSSPIPGRARETATPDSPKRNKGRQTVSRKLDPTQPRILILDSFGATHDSTRKVLKEYLVEEALDKKQVNLTYLPAGAATVVPQQSNFCDCGVFAMGYVEQFLKDPDEASRLLILKQTTGWPIHPPKLRTKIRNLIFDLQNEQTERLAKEKEEKRKAAKARKAEARLKAAEAISSSSSDAGKTASRDDTPKPTSNKDSPTDVAASTNGEVPNEARVDTRKNPKKDGSGVSVESNSEEFFSAKSSPEGDRKETRIAKPQKGTTARRRSQSPVFVKPLPCTSDEDNGDDDDKSTADGTQDSIEILETRVATPGTKPTRERSKRRT